MPITVAQIREKTAKSDLDHSESSLLDRAVDAYVARFYGGDLARVDSKIDNIAELILYSQNEELEGAVGLTHGNIAGETLQDKKQNIVAAVTGYYTSNGNSCNGLIPTIREVIFAEANQALNAMYDDDFDPNTAVKEGLSIKDGNEKPLLRDLVGPGGIIDEITKAAERVSEIYNDDKKEDLKNFCDIVYAFLKLKLRGGDPRPEAEEDDKNLTANEREILTIIDKLNPYLLSNREGDLAKYQSLLNKLPNLSALNFDAYLTGDDDKRYFNELRDRVLPYINEFKAFKYHEIFKGAQDIRSHRIDISKYISQYSERYKSYFGRRDPTPTPPVPNPAAQPRANVTPPGGRGPAVTPPGGGLGGPGGAPMLPLPPRDPIIAPNVPPRADGNRGPHFSVPPHMLPFPAMGTRPGGDGGFAPVGMRGRPPIQFPPKPGGLKIVPPKRLAGSSSMVTPVVPVHATPAYVPTAVTRTPTVTLSVTTKPKLPMPPAHVSKPVSLPGGSAALMSATSRDIGSKKSGMEGALSSLGSKRLGLTADTTKKGDVTRTVKASISDHVDKTTQVGEEYEEYTPFKGEWEDIDLDKLDPNLPFVPKIVGQKLESSSGIKRNKKSGLIFFEYNKEDGYSLALDHLREAQTEVAKRKFENEDDRNFPLTSSLGGTHHQALVSLVRLKDMSFATSGVPHFAVVRGSAKGGVDVSFISDKEFDENINYPCLVMSHNIAEYCASVEAAKQVLKEVKFTDKDGKTRTQEMLVKAAENEIFNIDDIEDLEKVGEGKLAEGIKNEFDKVLKNSSILVEESLQKQMQEKFAKLKDQYSKKYMADATKIASDWIYDRINQFTVGAVKAGPEVDITKSEIEAIARKYKGSSTKMVETLSQFCPQSYFENDAMLHKDPTGTKAVVHFTGEGPNRFFVAVGDSDFCVRVQTCRKNGTYEFYQDGKKVSKEFKVGDVIIDEGTVFRYDKKSGLDIPSAATEEEKQLLAGFSLKVVAENKSKKVVAAMCEGNVMVMDMANKKAKFNPGISPKVRGAAALVPPGHKLEAGTAAAGVYDL